MIWLPRRQLLDPSVKTSGDLTGPFRPAGILFHVTTDLTKRLASAVNRDFSAVNHVARDKGISPFLLLYVADHPDTSAQARRLGSVLNEAGIAAKLFGANDTDHSKINENLGLPDDPSTKAVFQFVGEIAKK